MLKPLQLIKPLFLISRKASKGAKNSKMKYFQPFEHIERIEPFEHVKHPNLFLRVEDFQPLQHHSL